MCLKEKAPELFQPLSMASQSKWLNGHEQGQLHSSGLQGSSDIGYLQAQFGSCQHLWESNLKERFKGGWMYRVTPGIPLIHERRMGGFFGQEMDSRGGGASSAISK